MLMLAYCSELCRQDFRDIVGAKDLPGDVRTYCLSNVLDDDTFSSESDAIISYDKSEESKPMNILTQELEFSSQSDVIFSLKSFI